MENDLTCREAVGLLGAGEDDLREAQIVSCLLRGEEISSIDEDFMVSRYGYEFRKVVGV